MKPLPGATTRFTFFAISHKHTAHNGSIFLPFVTLSFSTFCGLCSLCLSYQISPSFPGLQQSPELPACLARPAALLYRCPRGNVEQRAGTGGDPPGLPRPSAPVCGHQLSPAHLLRAKGRMPSLFQWEWAQCHWGLAAPASSEVKRMSSWMLSAPVWGKGAGTNMPCRSTNPALGAGVWESSRASAITQNPEPQGAVCWPCFVLHHNVQPLKGF